MLSPRPLQIGYDYIARGWPVLPLASGDKRPLTPHGVHDATLDFAVLARWIAENPDANIGIATGDTSGVVVVDIDYRNGGKETLQKCEAEHGPLPPTRTVRTGNGEHRYFATDRPCPSRKLGAGIDLLAEGRYAVAPPSLHPNGAAYTVEEDRPLAPLAEWISVEQAHAHAGAERAPVDVDSLNLPAHIVEDIRQGRPKGQRSEAIFAVIRALVERGYSDESIIGVMLKPEYGISEKPRERGLAWLQGEIRRAREKPLPKNGTGLNNTFIFKTVRASDLVRKEFPEQRWLMKKILPPGLTLFGGSPKQGKSWAALQIAVHVASTQGDVLYLALEDTERRLQDRTKKQCGEDKVPDRLHLYPQGAFPALDRGGLEVLEDWIRRHPNRKLLIVDTLAKVRSAPKGNGHAYADDYAALTGLKALADKYEMAILVVTHLRKMVDEDDPTKEISGTTGLTGCADTIWVLKRKRGEDTARLYVTGRDVESEWHDLRWDRECYQWKFASSKEPEYAGVKGEIASLLRKRGPLKQADIIAALGKAEGTIKSTLSRMVALGQLERPCGVYAVPGTVEPLTTPPAVATDETYETEQLVKPIEAKQPNSIRNHSTPSSFTVSLVSATQEPRS